MRLLPQLALLATLALPALSTAAYEINLSGKVVDATGKGVPQVEITLKGTAYKATTNASGAWVLQKATTALLGPTLSAARSLSEGQGAYSVSGRQLGDSRQLAQGVYVRKSAHSAVRNQALAKAAGEKDSLIVTYGTTEVGRLEQANLSQGKLADMMLLTVSPTLTQGSDNSTLASQFRLLGQTVLVNYAYDASLWRSSILTVGSTKTTITDPSQKQFSVTLGAKENATVNLALVTRLQTIAVPDMADQTYGDAALNVSATASSGLPVTIVSTTLSVCSVVNGQVNLLSAGSCTLKATQAGNADYNAVEIAFKAFAIAPKTLTVAANAKEYDGNTAATLTLTGILGSDEVTGNGVFASALAGSDKVVSDLALAGAHKDNYTLGAVTLLTADITKKTLTATADKPYDGSTVADLTLTGIVSSDDVTGSGLFASAQAGSDIAVTDLVLAGAQKDNYTLGTVTSLTANIVPKTLTASANDKVYDGSAATALSLTGIVGSDDITGNGVFSSALAGSDKTVSDLVLAGAQKDNYTLGTVTSLTANISKKTLTASANDKVYDGLTVADLTLTGIVGSDEVTGSGLFVSAQAGSDIAVTDLALAGTQKENYTLGVVTSLTADILKKTLIATADKPYDGSTAAALILSGIVGSDDVTGNGVFASALAGSGIAVTNLVLDGAQKDNYTLGSVTSLMANISKKTLTVAAKAGANLSKLYDGTTVNNTTLAKDTYYVLTGVVGAEVVDITVTGATYNSANVADAESVTATFSDVLTGAHASDYQIVAGSLEMPATIAKATLAFSSANPGSLFLASSPVTHTFSTNVDAGVTLASSTPSVCDYSAGSLTLKIAGLCTITATPIDAGNFNNSAQSQSFGVDRLYDERDEALYKIVKIDNQVWMAQNLNYSRENTLGWCYGDNADNCLNGYGRLYQWTDAMDIASTYLTATAVDVAKNRTTDALVTAAGPNRGICPSGWHVPSDGEWTALTDFVEAEDAEVSNAGAWLKAVVTGNDNWNNTNYNKQNTLGFSALPAGGRNYYGDWYYRGYAYFWSASEFSGSGAWYRYLNYDGASVARYYDLKNYGYSLRCLQD